MKRMHLVLVVSVLAAVCAQAQYRNTPSNGLRDALRMPALGLPLRTSGLLDPSKLRMSHYFSTEYATGGAGNSLSALYLNTMTYQANEKYRWLFALGYSGSAYNSSYPDATGGTPVGGVGFEWQPSRNVIIAASFSHNLAATAFGFRPYAYGWEWEQPYREIGASGR